MASCAQGDPIVRIWNVTSGQLLFNLSGHNSTVYNLILLPNGLLASGPDNNVFFWNYTAGKAAYSYNSTIAAKNGYLKEIF